jgi:hypothetical protein
MTRISKQVGWSNEAYLLYDILQELKRMNGIISKLVTYTTTTTTTSTPITTTTTTTAHITTTTTTHI